MRTQYLTFCIAITLATSSVAPIATVRGQPTSDNPEIGSTLVPFLPGVLIPTLSPQHAPPPPTTYSCGGGEGGHCYGVVQERPANLNGVSTSLTAVAMNGGDGHISDEMWLTQDDNCKGPCWIEVGLRAGLG